MKEESSGRQSAVNILTTRPGVINGSQIAKTRLKCWNLFMSSEMIVQCTNLQIGRKNLI